MTDDRTDAEAVFYGGPADGQIVTIELDPDSGQPAARHGEMFYAPPVDMRRPPPPGYVHPAHVIYRPVVDQATGVAFLDGQGRFRYVPKGTKL